VAEEVNRLLEVGSWRRLMMIREPVIRSLTLEVLATFEFDRDYSSFSDAETIQFRVFGQMHGMSVTQFLVRLGLYDEAFTKTEDYEHLPTDYPGSLTP